MKLQAIVTQFVAFRKSLGEGFRANEKVLKSFCRALGDRLEVDEVRASQVDAFLAGTGPLSSAWHVKYRALRGFYRYALTRGYVKDSPLPVVIPKRPQLLVPYVYSREELKRRRTRRRCPALRTTPLVSWVGAASRGRTSDELSPA